MCAQINAWCRASQSTWPSIHLSSHYRCSSSLIRSFVSLLPSHYSHRTLARSIWSRKELSSPPLAANSSLTRVTMENQGTKVFTAASATTHSTLTVQRSTFNTRRHSLVTPRTCSTMKFSHPPAQLAAGSFPSRPRHKAPSALATLYTIRLLE